MKEINWGSPLSLACLGVFFGGIAAFLHVIWSNLPF